MEILAMQKRLILLFIILAAFFSACGTTELAAPKGLLASEPDSENPNKIEISWDAVEGAGIYYVYISEDKEGPFEDAGFSVSSKDSRYYFVDNFEAEEGGTYYYCVTAAKNESIGHESARSPVVAASTYSGSWSEKKELGDAAYLRLAADFSNLFAVYSNKTGDDLINVTKYALEENSEEDDPPYVWTSLESPGRVVGSNYKPFSVFISGNEIHTIFCDKEADTGGALSMKYYHDSSEGDEDPSFKWTGLGSASFSGNAVEGIGSVATNIGITNSTYVLFKLPEIKLYKHDSEWFDSTVDSLSDADSTLSLLSHNTNLYVGYTNSGGKLFLRAFNNGALQEGGEVTGTAVSVGNAVFVSGGGIIHVVFIDTDGNFSALKYEESNWEALGNINGKPQTTINPEAGSITATWHNNRLYVFYSGTDGAYVRYYDEDEGWKPAQRNNDKPIALADASSLQLVSGNALYAGFIENNKATIRILE